WALAGRRGGRRDGGRGQLGGASSFACAGQDTGQGRGAQAAARRPHQLAVGHPVEGGARFGQARQGHRRLAQEGGEGGPEGGEEGGARGREGRETGCEGAHEAGGRGYDEGRP